MNERLEGIDPNSAAKQYLNKLLGVLKDSKELITLIAFFSGGAVWTVNYFATRQQLDSTRMQMEEYRCISDTSVKMIQASMNSDFLKQMHRSGKQELRATKDALAKAAPNSEGYMVLVDKVEEIEAQLKDFEEKRSKSQVVSEEAFEKLRTNGCKEASKRSQD